MNAARDSFPQRRRGLSLERKLPLAASAILATVLFLYTWIAYREVATSGLLAAHQRDSVVADELARLTATSSVARARLVSSIANQPEVRAALAGTTPMRSIDSAFNALRTPADSSPRITVFNAQRRPVHAIEAAPDPEVLSHLSPLFEKADARDSLSVSSKLFNYGGRAYFWTVAAVREAGRTLGYVAHFRPVRTTEAASRALKALLGSDNRILFANRGDTRSALVELDGTLVGAPRRMTVDHGIRRYERDGDRYLAASETIAATPYSVLVETPYSATQARAQQFLRRTGVLGLLLLLLATLFVWIASRRFTGPIGELNAAAARITRAQFGEQVHVRRHDELGRLAESFNQMSRAVHQAVADAESSRAQAEQANRAKSEFLANMSHEIRTPINAMLGYTDLIAAGISGPLTGEQQQQLERIRVSGLHLTGLIDDLLDFARLDTARLSVQKRNAAAADAVATALTVVKPQADAKPVIITTDVEHTRYTGDPQRVEQILVNLLGNAVKFTPAHGRIHLQCRAVTGNGARPRLQFVVEDTGPGIPADRLATIFDPFVQGHSGYTRPHGGSGLGLTISRRLAELMDGSIEVESEEGAGARFTLTLPIAA